MFPFLPVLGLLWLAGSAGGEPPVLCVGEMDEARQRRVYAEFVRQESARLQDRAFHVVRELGEGRFAVSFGEAKEPEAIVLAEEVPLQTGSAGKGLLYPAGVEVLDLVRPLPAYRLVETAEPASERPATRRTGRGMVVDRRRPAPSADQRADTRARALAEAAPFAEWIESLRIGGVAEISLPREDRCRTCNGWGRVTAPDSSDRREGSVHKGRAGADGKVACGSCEGKGVLVTQVRHSIRY